VAWRLITYRLPAKDCTEALEGFAEQVYQARDRP
jgi:hypothetical protein